MKRIILCADDYGQNSAISQAIVELLKINALSATSCMTNTAAWLEWAKYLTPLQGKADVGIHLNLTQGKPLSGAFNEFYTLKELLIKSALRQLNKKAIASEFRAQLDAFSNAYGQLPDFIDGHHHIHQLPIIRDVIFDIFDESFRAHGAYVRCTYDPRTVFRLNDVAYLKQFIIQICGAMAFKREIVKRQIPHNRTFAGIYDFSDSYEYGELFPRFVKQVNDGGIIMCHPGLLSSNEEDDEIATSRHNEYNYFSGTQYKRLCIQNGIQLARFKDLA